MTTRNAIFKNDRSLQAVAQGRIRACALLLSGLNEHASNRDLFMQALSAELADHAIPSLQVDLSGMGEGADVPDDLLIRRLYESIDDALTYMRREFGIMPMIVARGPVGNLLLDMNGVKRVLINPTFFCEARRPRVAGRPRHDPGELRSRFTAIALRDLRVENSRGVPATLVAHRDDLLSLEGIYERYAHRKPPSMRDKLIPLFPQVVDGDVRIGVRPDAGHYDDFMDNPLLQFKLRRHVVDLVLGGI